MLNSVKIQHFWWAGMDSNHRTQMRTDLQSAAFSHSATYPFMFATSVTFVIIIQLVIFVNTFFIFLYWKFIPLKRFS